MKSSRIWILVFLLTVILVFDTYDLYIDVTLNAGTEHMFEEGIMIFVTFLVIAYLIYVDAKQRLELKEVQSQLKKSQSLLDEQKEKMQEARKEYSGVIKGQFEEWGLTSSETETAFLLLKGLSFREIAEIRDVKEKSVRQQASQIYQKSELPGRHALAAWFFEDFIG